MQFLETIVVQRSQRTHASVFADASPQARVHRAAPPFLAVHGSHDSVIPVGEARAFVDALRATSVREVGFIVLDGAGLGFDMTDRHRTPLVNHAVAQFLEHAYRYGRTSPDRAVV
jgi:dipeptidyl aminopeptidase/acylaminoacyl peptidase